MKTKTIINIAGLCLLVLAVSILWFNACASGDGSRGERGLAVEELPFVEADIEVFPQLGHTGGINCVAVSPDGKYFLSSGSNDYAVKLWDAETGREIKTFLGHKDRIQSISFSPDGKYFISGSSDKTIKLWNLETGQEIRTFSGHSNYVWSVCFSPDGNYFVSGSWDKTSKIWDVATGREIRTLSGNTSVVVTVAFSTDGRTILSNSGDSLKLWNADTGQEIKSFPASNNTATFSPDGKQILIIAGLTFRLLDIETGKENRIFRGHTGQVTGVTFSPDGSKIVSTSSDGGENINGGTDIKLWNAETGRLIRTLSSSIGTATFTPDGKFVIAGLYDETFLKVWDVETGREINYLGYVNGVMNVKYSRDGKYIIVSTERYSFGDDNRLKFWDIAAGRQIMSFSGHTKPIYSVAFSQDGKQILSGAGAFNPDFGEIKLWDVETGQEIKTFAGHRGVVRAVAFSPDGRQALSGSDDKTIKLWNVETGREIRTFSGHTGSVSSVVFSPDGRQVLSGSWDDTVKLWDAATGREIRTFSGHTYSVNSAMFSPDGELIISSSWDHSIKIWETKTGKEIRTFSGLMWIDYAEFSSDGKFILAFFGEKGRIWETATGAEIKNISGFGGVVRAVSPDGKQIFSSINRSLRLYDIENSREIASFISFSGSDTQLAAASRGLTVETETTASAIEGEWLSITPDGYYQASPRGDRYLNVRVNNTVSGIDAYRSIFYNPDVVQARLQGRPDPASKANVTIQQAASFTPPTVTIQSPANFTTTNTATTNLSVAITSTSQPVKNIKILVNGRLIGRDELTSVTGTGLQPERASLTVTGNQKTVNFNLPLELEPGDNRIEVVAFNGYSENRRFVDVTRNAPTGERPPLPSLWIVAVGVNGYDNAGPRLGGMTSLNFAVADAKGLIDSLKAQEGKRYAKVNSMLIADEEQLVPTAENIRQGFKFLEGADPRRDVVVLFLAGHGISAQEGKFFFLPKDAAMNGKNVDVGRSISGDEIMGVLDAPGNRLVFIDACNSGGVDNDRMVRSLMDTNAFVFAASRGNEFSYEDPKLGHGYFTYSIMSALGGAPAALAQGNVSVLSMSGYVKDDVPKRTNGRQNPSAYSLGFYDFPVAVIGR